MNPTPQCKTAIISFIIDEILFKLWNLSSNMRKRVQMVLQNRDITVLEYSPKVFLINKWVRVKGIDKETTKEIQKGVSNYKLTNQPQINEVVFLNGKLRCSEICFIPERVFDCDSIEELEITSRNYDLYSKCTFRRIHRLSFSFSSKDRIEYFLSKTSKVDCIHFSYSKLPPLDLSNFKVKELSFYKIEFTDSVSLPSSLERLDVNKSKGVSFKNASKKVKKFDSRFAYTDSDASYSWISSFKGLRAVAIFGKLSNFIDYFPSSIRSIDSGTVEQENVDLAERKEKFPYLIRMRLPVSIEAAQALGLRDIDPRFTETNTVFDLKPRRIKVTGYNVKGLNQHPELFDEVEEVEIYLDGLNFELLPEGIKRITLYLSFWDLKDKAAELEKSLGRFKETEFSLLLFSNCDSAARIILGCLKTSKTVAISSNLKHLVEDYSHLRFDIKYQC